MSTILTASDFLADFDGSIAKVDALITTNADTLKPTAMAIVFGVLAEAAAAAAPVVATALAGAAGGPPGLALAVATQLGQYAVNQLNSHTAAVAALTPDQQALVAQLIPAAVSVLQQRLQQALPVPNHPTA